MKVVSRVDVRFMSWGSEVRVTYSYKEGEVCAPGTKKRATSAATMARAALARALEDLDKGNASWGGNGTDFSTCTTIDAVLIDVTRHEVQRATRPVPP